MANSDSDLDDEILAGMGLGGKRPRRAADSDSDEGVLVPTARKKAGATRKARATPAAKRRKGDADEALSDEEGEDDEDDGYGSDLYYDEADRAKLNAMTQLEREMALAERAEKRNLQKERRNLLGKKAGKASEIADAAGRSSARERATDAKRSAMNKIKEARERKAQADRGRRSRRGDGEYGASDEELSDVSSVEGDAYAERARGTVTGRDDAGPAGGAAYDLDVQEREEADEASFEDVKSIQVRRYKMEVWVHQPFFEACLPGAIVRVSLGQKQDSATGMTMVKYAMARVDAVVERPAGTYRDVPGKPYTNPYQFGAGAERTSKWLELRRGSSVKLFPMALVSNSSVSEEEFDDWQRTCAKDRVPGISRQEVEQARAALLKAENYTYSAADVQTMLEAKRSKGRAVGSSAVEKARLQRLLATEEEAGRVEEAAAVAAQLAELEARLATAPVGSKVGISEINKKNAAINFRNLLHNVSNRPDADRAATAGGDELAADKFSRRKTRPRQYFSTTLKKEGGGALSVEQETEEVAASPAPVPSQSKPARLRPKAEIIPEVLEIDIDLDLLALEPPMPLLARQLLGSCWQAGLSSYVRADEGTRPQKMLTLNDYKRRQGIS